MMDDTDLKTRLFRICCSPDWSTLKSLKPPVGIVADLLVRNGTIFTSDTSLPFADSMAIRNGRILKVGSFATLKVLNFFLFTLSVLLMTTSLA